MVESIPETDFEEMCRLDNRFKRGYNLLTNCYKDATDSGFHFEHDAFGGYGLFLKGGDLYVKKKKDFLLPGLHAVLQTVNDEDVDKFEPISIFARTDLCKKNRIMVGPVRFANHSCKPNSEYVASSYKGHQCVRLRALQNIRRDYSLLWRKPLWYWKLELQLRTCCGTC